MFIYFHWPKNGNYCVQAFNKESDAIHYVIELIDNKANGNYGGYKPKKKKVPYDDFAAAVGAPQLLNNIHIDAVIQEVPKRSLTTTDDNSTTTEELLKLKEHIKIAKKQKTLENALIAIKLYEEYASYVLCDEAAIHKLEDLRVAK